LPFYLYLKGRDHSGTRDSLKNRMKMDLKEMWWEVVDWMNLAQGRDKWRALMNTILKSPFHKRRRNSLLSE
jgi:hypothetical protein